MTNESTPLTLDEMMAWVYANNKNHGWFDQEREFPADVALLHSEVSEAFEAYREWGLEDATKPGLDKDMKPGKPEGVGSELADVLVRLLDTCKRYDIDLEAEFVRKMKFNETRPYKHGKRM